MMWIDDWIYIDTLSDASWNLKEAPPVTVQEWLDKWRQLVKCEKDFCGYDEHELMTRMVSELAALVDKAP